MRCEVCGHKTNSLYYYRGYNICSPDCEYEVNMMIDRLTLRELEEEEYQFNVMDGVEETIRQISNRRYTP